MPVAECRRPRVRRAAPRCALIIDIDIAHVHCTCMMLCRRYMPITARAKSKLGALASCDAAEPRGRLHPVRTRKNVLEPHFAARTCAWPFVPGLAVTHESRENCALYASRTAPSYASRTAPALQLYASSSLINARAWPCAPGSRGELPRPRRGHLGSVGPEVLPSRSRVLPPPSPWANSFGAPRALAKPAAPRQLTLERHLVTRSVTIV